MNLDNSCDKRVRFALALAISGLAHAIAESVGIQYRGQSRAYCASKLEWLALSFL